MNIILNWPQIIVVLLMAVSVINHTINHGEFRGNYNAYINIGDQIILFALLYWGGFFS